mgnify:CR=1 FL=1
MSYETEFMKEFEEWIKTQVMINEMALEESKKVFDLQGKFENFHAGKGFHDLPEGLFGERKY